MGTAKPVKTTLMGINFVLFRGSDGRVRCLKDTCPHRGAPLSAGWTAEARLPPRRATASRRSPAALSAKRVAPLLPHHPPNLEHCSDQHAAARHHGCVLPASSTVCHALLLLPACDALS